jgi:uncharacterized membrane protein YdfJ with MMPL/SSD domain
MGPWGGHAWVGSTIIMLVLLLIVIELKLTLDTIYEIDSDSKSLPSGVVLIDPR